MTKQGVTLPAGRSDSNKKWLWIMGIAAFLVIAAAAITAGVLVLKDDNENGRSRGKNEEHDPTKPEHSKPLFTESKSAIDWICGENKTLDECEEACDDVPECCKWDGECLHGFDGWKGCVDYAKCHVVKGWVEPAPPNLEDLCTASDKRECEAACRDVECCYKDEQECENAFWSLTCLDYAHCQNLRNNSRVPTAVEGLEEFCNPLAGPDGRDLCEAECKKAECCWSWDELDENSNCLESDFLPCLTYAPCGLLIIPEANAAVPPAPENLFNDICAKDKIWGAGPDRDACQAVCNEAECCGNLDLTDGIRNCFLDDPFGCAAYAPCGLLHVTGGDVPRAPEDLKETCRWQTFYDDPTKEQECEDVCNQARCCWDDEENCLTDGNLLTCLEYAPCAILLFAGGDVPLPDSDALAAACSPAAYEENPLTCRSFCRDGAAGCCFETEDLKDNCYVYNLDTCTSWALGGCFRIGFV